MVQTNDAPDTYFKLLRHPSGQSVNQGNPGSDKKQPAAPWNNTSDCIRRLFWSGAKRSDGIARPAQRPGKGAKTAPVQSRRSPAGWHKEQEAENNISLQEDMNKAVQQAGKKTALPAVEANIADKQ